MFIWWICLSTTLFQDRIQIDERMRVSRVVLDVVAYSKKSGPITGLAQKDFTLYENGKKIPITFFEIRDFREAPQTLTSDVDLLPINQPFQQIIFVLDLEATLKGQPFQALKQVENTLKKLEPNRNYKIAIYSMESGMLTDGFVPSPSMALDLLDRYRDGYLTRGQGDEDSLLFPRKNNRFKVTRGVNGRISQLDTDTPDILELEKSFQHCLDLFSPDSRMACMETTFQDFMAWQSIRTERVIGELESLTYAFEDNADLKIMLYISPGFGLNGLQSAQKLYRVYSNQAQGIQNVQTNHLNDMPSGAARLNYNGNFKRVLHACIRNRVIFHTFDLFHKGAAMSRSLGVEQASRSHPAIVDSFRQYTRDMDSGLRTLAEKSGGSFYLTGNLADSAQKALVQNRYYYVLGYSSPPGKAGHYRKIKIKVKRRRTKLLYRQGYYGE